MTREVRVSTGAFRIFEVTLHVQRHGVDPLRVWGRKGQIQTNPPCRTDTHTWVRVDTEEWATAHNRFCTLDVRSNPPTAIIPSPPSQLLDPHIGADCLERGYYTSPLCEVDHVQRCPHPVASHKSLTAQVLE